MQTLLMQQWEIAKGVYRFTLGQTLNAGEYALIEVVPGKTDSEQLSIYVWDFRRRSPAPAWRHTKQLSLRAYFSAAVCGCKSSTRSVANADT